MHRGRHDRGCVRRGLHARRHRGCTPRWPLPVGFRVPRPVDGMGDALGRMLPSGRLARRGVGRLPAALAAEGRMDGRFVPRHPRCLGKRHRSDARRDDLARSARLRDAAPCPRRSRGRQGESEGRGLLWHAVEKASPPRAPRAGAGRHRRRPVVADAHPSPRGADARRLPNRGANVDRDAGGAGRHGRRVRGSGLAPPDIRQGPRLPQGTRGGAPTIAGGGPATE